MACGANRKRDGHSSGTPVARRIKQPTRMTGPDRPEAFAPTSLLFGLAPGGVCRAVSVAGNAVRSYRTVSPLPRPNATRRGGLFSVALSLGFDPRLRGDRPPPDVIRHRLSMEPGLSSPATFRPWRGAAVRPTDGIGMGIPGRRVKHHDPTGLRKSHIQPGGRISPMARAGSRSMPATSAAWRGPRCHRRAPGENGAGRPLRPRAWRHRRCPFPPGRSRRSAKCAAA